MLVTQYVSKLMIRQKFGSIINVSSITAIDGNAGQISYGSSKAALIGATKTLASELGDHGIRVNAVAPGVVTTDMTASIPAESFARLCSRIPMGRAGAPAEAGRGAVVSGFGSIQLCYRPGAAYRRRHRLRELLLARN